MNITSRLYKFLQQQEIQDLINSNEWGRVYQALNLYVENNSEFISEFTQLLLTLNINPLKHMDYIPVYYLYGSNIRSFTIPKNIRNIASNAFARCYNLTNIIIPNNVIVIGERAFNHCTSLEKVVLGNSVKTIDERAFFNCKSLTNIIIPDSVNSIGGSTFEYCGNLATVSISDNVTILAPYLFHGCTSLSSLIVGKNTSKIMSNVLLGTKINNIVYNNTVENWRKIEIHKSNNELFKCTINCIDGDLKYNKDSTSWDLIK